MLYPMFVDIVKVFVLINFCELHRLHCKAPVATKLTRHQPLDYHVWGATLQAFHKLQSKAETIPELKSTLQRIWDDLPQTTIDKAINNFRKTSEHMHFG